MVLSVRNRAPPRQWCRGDGRANLRDAQDLRDLQMVRSLLGTFRVRTICLTVFALAGCDSLTFDERAAELDERAPASCGDTFGRCGFPQEVDPAVMCILRGAPRRPARGRVERTEVPLARRSPHAELQADRPRRLRVNASAVPSARIVANQTSVPATHDSGFTAS